MNRLSFNNEESIKTIWGIFISWVFTKKIENSLKNKQKIIILLEIILKKYHIQWKQKIEQVIEKALKEYETSMAVWG